MPEGFAGFVLPLLRSGMRVLDAGCATGALTRAFGTAAYPIQVLGVDVDVSRLAGARHDAESAAVSTVDFVAGQPSALPFAAEAFDVVFAHGVVERTRDPLAVLGELSRVLRPGGTLALSTTDWSRTRLTPRTANVDAALRGWHLVRQRAGGDPFAGKRIAAQVALAGFHDVRAKARYHPGAGYVELAREVEADLASEIEKNGRDPLLASAARSAWAWVRGGDRGDVTECWVEVVARR